MVNNLQVNQFLLNFMILKLNLYYQIILQLRVVLIVLLKRLDYLIVRIKNLCSNLQRERD